MKQYWENGQLIWVAPGSVHYDMEQVELLLPYLEHMREGHYPTEPDGGYLGGNKSGISCHAPFETVCQVAAEIESRLSHTGLDRYLVEEVYCNSLSPSELSHKLGLKPWEISRRVKSAVSYISSGPCPRWLNCIDCQKYSKCNRKKRVGISYREWVRSRSKYHKAKSMRSHTKT